MNTKMSFTPSLFKVFILVACLMLSSISYASQPTFNVSYSPTTIGVGSVSTMTYTIDNSAETTTVSEIGFTNTLPAGMTIASPDFAFNTCINGSYSATPGSHTISFSGYRLGAGASCSFQVDVTSTTANVYTNTTSALSTSTGSVVGASANLTVDNNRPGFSMAFSSAVITPGAVSTLIYTIDNSANSSAANPFLDNSLTFTHTLPTGLSFSEQHNATTDCNSLGFPRDPILTVSGQTLAMSQGGLVPGQTCTVSADVTTNSAGVYQAKTGVLSQSGSNPSGQASAELRGDNSFMFMAFPNTSAPGTTVDLSYTINNLDRLNAAEDITFTLDLNATLSGLTATALPDNGFCGTGSTMTNSSSISDINGRSTSSGIITVSDANLSAEASCTFKISVAIPLNAAAGNYTNTTSTINLTQGSVTTKPAVTSLLTIKKAPQISMSVVDIDTANAGDDVTFRYVVTNTDPDNSATELSFSMPLFSTVPGIAVNSLPTLNSCGIGSTFTTNTSYEGITFNFVDGSIVAGGNCSFDIVLTLPAETSYGDYVFTTSTLVGSVSGETVYGNKGQDTLTVITAPNLLLAITEEQIAPGGQVTLELTLDYNENAAESVSNVGFTIDLASVLTGLTAISVPSGEVCGAGSSISGSSILTFTGGSLTAANQCTFFVTLAVPNNAPYSEVTLISSVVSGTTGGNGVISAAVSDTLLISSLHLAKSFSSDVVLAGDTISLDYTLTNTSTDATSISFTDSMNSVLGSLSATTLPITPCGAGSSITGTTSLSFSGGSLDSGASCTFTVELQVPVNAPDGIYNSVTSGVTATINGANTMSIAATATLEVQSLTALLTTAEGNSTASNPILVNINFSRDVLGFTVEDLDVNNATLDNFSGSGSNYQVNLIPSSNGQVTLDLPANTVVDLVDNNVSNPPANQLVIVYNSNPTMSVLIPSLNVNTNGSSFNVSGTSLNNGLSAGIFSDNDNDGIPDSTTPLASATVIDGSWLLVAPITLGNANNFVLGIFNQETREIEIIDVPTITEITNFAPVISGTPSNVAAEDSAYTFTPTVTDTNSSDTQTFSITNKPTWATFSTTTGVLTGTPANLDVGVTTGIVISVTDSANATVSLSAFSLTVSNTNDAPIAQDDNASTDDITILTIDVLANDTDVDNDELTLISAIAEQGSIDINNNMLVYTPLIGFDGVDTVTYHVDDNNGGENQGQAIITVNAYETITITNKSSGGSFGPVILLLGSVMLFIRRKNALMVPKALPRKTCLSLLALLSVSVSSYADEASTIDYFIKTELGQSKAKASGLSKQFPVGVITQIDDKATSRSIGLGVNITNDWNATLSYIDMGHGSLVITGDTLNSSEYHQSVAQVVPVLVKGIGINSHYHFLQREQYNASVLVGLLFWNSDVISAYEDQRIDHDNDGIDMYYGIEGTYKINEAWGVNIGIKRYALDVNDIDIGYLGLTYQF